MLDLGVHLSPQLAVIGLAACGFLKAFHRQVGSEGGNAAELVYEGVHLHARLAVVQWSSGKNKSKSSGAKVRVSPPDEACPL